MNGYIGGMIGREFPTGAIAYGLFNMQNLFSGYVNPAGPFNAFNTVDVELDALYAEYYSTVGDTSDVQQRINARLVDQAWALPVVGAPLSYYLLDGYTGIEADRRKRCRPGAEGHPPGLSRTVGGQLHRRRHASTMKSSI